MFLPFDCDQPKTAPISPVTHALVAANVIAFALVCLTGHPAETIHEWAFHPRSPGPLAWIAHLFLHAGPGHLIGNMIFLHVAGRPLEYRLGWKFFLLVYFVGGFAADMAEGIVSATPIVGASGAIAALMGAYIVLLPWSTVRVFYWIGLFWWGVWECSAFFLVGFWAAVNLLFLCLLGGEGGVAYAAHLGGLGFGIAAAYAIEKLALTPVPRVFADRGPRTFAGERKPVRIPSRKRDGDDFLALERASSRAQLERALGRRDRRAALRAYEQADLLGVRPVLEAAEQWNLAWVLLDQEAVTLGAKALEDLVRVHPESSEASRARTALRDLRAGV
ncbi:MAG TPA: rhomboid family intramembrane serine protease [Planctomycetota bacterium]|nr:rhomboid family intramembrane serine protease [Planctomycetota bacterium]